MKMKPTKKSDGSNTKPYNVRLMTPAEIAGVKKSKSTAKPTTKASKSLTGEKAAEALKKRTSPKGVKEFEKGAKKALEKKYPGLYKKSK
jgi:hypothetical protein